MSSSDTPNDPSETSHQARDDASSGTIGADEKRKARVIDGTAEDVTDAPAAVARNGGGGAMAIALPVGTFFVGAALLAGVLWQAGLLNTTALNSVAGGGVGAPADVSQRLESADTRIAALLRDVERLGGELSDVQDARSSLETKLADVETQLAAATGAETEQLASADDLNAALRLITEIDGRVADAETALDVASGVAETAVQPDQIAALQAVITSLEERVASAEETIVNAQAAERRVAAMEAGVAAIGSQQTSQATELGAVRAQIGALSARADAAKEALAAQSSRLEGLDTAESSLSERLGEVEKRVDRPEAARRAALGIALATLAGAVNGGAPFADELAAVDALAPGTPQVAALGDVAQRGVMDAPALLRALQPVARDALKADAAGNAQGAWQRFTGNAMSLITVRETGNVEGDGLEARLARMEVALGAGDAAAAVSEAQAVDGPAAGALAGWLDDARARAEADELMVVLRTDLLANLANAHAPEVNAAGAGSSDVGSGDAGSQETGAGEAGSSEAGSGEQAQ